MRFDIHCRATSTFLINASSDNWLFESLIPVGAGSHALHRAAVKAAARATGSFIIVKFNPLAPEIRRGASAPVGTSRANAPVAGNFICHSIVLLLLIYTASQQISFTTSVKIYLSRPISRVSHTHTASKCDSYKESEVFPYVG